jgi:hypothetical protein
MMSNWKGTASQTSASKTKKIPVRSIDGDRFVLLTVHLTLAGAVG